MSAATVAAAALGFLLLADGDESGQGSAEAHADIVARAFEALDNGYDSAWAFTETSTKDGVVRIAAYDPRRPDTERWTLVSIDGQAPSDANLESFVSEKQKSDEAKAERNGRHHAVVSIEPGTLRLVEETNDHWRFGFVPGEENDDDEFMRHVDGTLDIAKDGEYVRSIVMRNSRPIKPGFGVKIKTFYVELAFGPAVPDGPIVPQRIDAEVEGRAFFAVGIRERESVRYTDYARVGDSREVVPDR